MELHKLPDIVFDTYTSAVGEKHTTAARRDRLALLLRKVGTPTQSKESQKSAPESRKIIIPF